MTYSKAQVEAFTTYHMENFLIHECFKEVFIFFNDVPKTLLWFETENPMLGNIRPMDMILKRRTDKLYTFIKNAKEGNFA